MYRNIQDQSNIFGELIQSCPNVVELDLSMNSITMLPNDLSAFKHLASFDIRSNPFVNFEQVVSSLTTLPSLVDLKVNLIDESQVKLILSQLPNLQFLNGKSTKDDTAQPSSIVDLNDEEIKNISLQNEIQSFNEVYKKVSEKLKQSNMKDNLKDGFQNLIKSEINKINSNYETVPNYIYATNVIESQLSLYSFFNEKFLTYLDSKDDSGKLGRMINENITKSYLLLIKIIYKLYPKINEKTQTMKMQIEEAMKAAQNDDMVYDDKVKQVIKEKDLLLMQCQEEINMLNTKIAKLENENKIMTEKFINSAKSIINNNIKEEKKVSQYPPSKNSYGALNRKASKDKLLVQPPSSKVINNTSFCNNNSSLQASPVCTRVFTIKMMKETINDIYTSKAEFDKKSEDNKLPRETLEQHMYTYLNQKYGLKQIIIEWASNIINGIKIFSSEDSEIFLFGKILRNEIEEDSRFVYGKLRQSVLDVMTYFLKAKFPLKSVADIQSMRNAKENGCVNEEDWKKVINYLYEAPDAKFLENKIIDVIQKKYLKNKFDSDKKLTREEIINLTKVKDEYNIPFKDFIKILHEFQIKTREKYLRNFVIMFKKFDTDNNGIIDEEEFINLIYNLNLFVTQIKENVVNLLTLVDPYNNKQITFSECVTLLSNQPYKDEQGNIKGSLLDKVCLDDTANFNYSVKK